jgi:hypothetical protein
VKFIITVVLLLLATGIVSYNNGTFHFSKEAAAVAYEHVKESTANATEDR